MGPPVSSSIRCRQQLRRVGPDESQALDLGLVDEIAVDLAPVLLGEGIRFFGELARSPLLLDDPQVIEGTRVTHLRFRVRRPTE